ncbi:MAG: Bifunctional phosphoglucose/phosphomannose isomerase [Desulfotomaculum sp. 46_296]|nr:MAG: Bifunctional phosphoglucose/phosphomannose isomerase [Desulfotomaculum sp. 46_296]
MWDILDNPEAISRIDTQNMLASLWNLPDQCSEAWKIGNSVDLPAEIKADKIVVTGLGGSAIGGDLLRVFSTNRLAVPVFVNRHYSLPLFVDQQTLIFAVSYSGNTEETLSAYHIAREKKATIIVLTTGGKLKDMAQADKIPAVTVPGGISPRAATGYLFIPMLAVLERIGLVTGISEEVAELVQQLRLLRNQLGPQVELSGNLSKQLAARLYGHIPVIWGSSGTTEVVAQRWKGQFNENTKTPAYWNVFPELNHNEIVGFETPAEILKNLFLIILRSKDDHARVQKRIEITHQEIGDKVAGVAQIQSAGDTILSRMYSLIYTGDYTSIYLALLYGIDPGPVKVIDRLKEALASQ